MALTDIEQFITQISTQDIERYKQYWQTIKPVTHEEFFKRWVFAFLSVHTSWMANVRAYQTISNETELTEKDKLMSLIVVSRVGLIKMRTTGIWKFKEDFYNNPVDWYKQPEEPWVAYRDRVEDKCYGLGFAKSSFAIELCYPNECEVTCLDTHMLRLYGTKSSPVPSPSAYKELESHWVSKCKEYNFPPFMVRNMYWDKVQKKQDTRYWSYVFESTPQPQQQEQIYEDESSSKETLAESTPIGRV